MNCNERICDALRLSGRDRQIIPRLGDAAQLLSNPNIAKARLQACSVAPEGLALLHVDVEPDWTSIDRTIRRGEASIRKTNTSQSDASRPQISSAGAEWSRTLRQRTHQICVPGWIGGFCE